MFPVPGNNFLAIFQTVLLAQYNTIQYNTKTSIPVPNIRLHNSYFYKNPTTPQDGDLCTIYCILVHSFADSCMGDATADNTAKKIMSISFQGRQQVLDIYIYSKLIHGPTALTAYPRTAKKMVWQALSVGEVTVFHHVPTCTFKNNIFYRMPCLEI
jgi:hypothetical protein